MKKVLSSLAIALLFAACQNKDATTNIVTSADTIKADTTVYPYTVKKVHNWKMNTDPKNMIVAMSAIKAFANLDSAALKPYLADSIWLVVDHYSFKGTKAKFIEEAQHEMEKFAKIDVELEDMESVVSGDKSEEWVSLWYKQVSHMKDGKIDTINFFNDFKIINGKIAGWSEYVQHPMKKGK